MGLHTSYLGRICVRPVLNAQEVDFLRAFSQTRHGRGRHPLDVARHPEDDQKPVRDAGWHSPGVWCPWTPCGDGCCLQWDGIEKPYAPDEWLSHLIDVLLRAGAELSEDRQARALGLTFDHVLDGMLVGERHETNELFALQVTRNRVQRRVLLPARPGVDHYGYRNAQEERRVRRDQLTARRKRYARAVEEDRLRDLADL